MSATRHVSKTIHSFPLATGLLSTKAAAVYDFFVFKTLAKFNISAQITSLIGEFSSTLAVSNHQWSKLEANDEFLEVLHRFPLFQSLPAPALSLSSKGLHAHYMGVLKHFSAVLPPSMTKGIHPLDFPLVEQRNTLVMKGGTPLSYLSEVYKGTKGYVQPGSFHQSQVMAANQVTDGVLAFPLEANNAKVPKGMKIGQVFTAHSGVFFLSFKIQLNEPRTELTYCSLMISSSTENVSLMYLPIHQSLLAPSLRSATHAPYPWVFVALKQGNVTTSEYLMEREDNLFRSLRFREMMMIASGKSLSPRLTLRSASTTKLEMMDKEEDGKKEPISTTPKEFCSKDSGRSTPVV